MSKKPRREKALLANCPKCGAPAGVACEGKNGTARASVHQARLTAPAKFEKAKTQWEPNNGFYSSEEWRRLRYRALKREGGACQCCGSRGAGNKPLHVDHIKPRSRFPELELDLNNLQVLCEDCNLGKSAWDQTDWRAGETLQ